MTFTWCISPGLSIRYSDAAESTPSSPRCAASSPWASTRLGLFAGRYPHPAAASAGPRRLRQPGATRTSHLISEVFAALPPGVGAHRVPHGVLGHGRRSRTWRRWAQGLDPRIDLFWTGRAICSPTPGPGGRRDLHAYRQPPAHLLGQLPGQRRGHGRTSCTSVRTAVETRSCGVRRRASSPTAWSCSRRRGSPSRPSPTTSAIREGYDPEAELAACDARRRRARRTCRGVRAVRGQRALVLPLVRRRAHRARRPGVRRCSSWSTGMRTRRRQPDLGALADRLLAAADHLLRGPGRRTARSGDEIRPWLRGVRDRRPGHPKDRRPGRCGAAGRGRAQRSWPRS